jgi:hypothetical protein
MLNLRAIGTFPSYQATEIALQELKDSGFPMDRISVIGRDIHDHNEATGVNTSNRLEVAGNLDTDENEAGETARKGAIAGSTIGGLTGLLIGLGVLAIPGVGPVMLAGAAATVIATAVSGGVIGAAAGSLAGGLVGLGIPEDRAKIYSDHVAEGKYLVMVEGSQAEIAAAERIFTRHNIHDWYTYNLPIDSTDSSRNPSTYYTQV